MTLSFLSTLRALRNMLQAHGNFASGVCVLGLACLLAAPLMAQHSVSYRQVVDSADPMLQWTSPAAIPFGEPLTSAQLSASAGTAGSFVYTPSVGQVLQPGANQLSVVFTPSSFNFHSSTLTVTLQVDPPGSSSFQVQLTPPVSDFDGRTHLLHGEPLSISGNVLPVGNFHQPVTLACVSPRTDVECNFSPSVVSPAMAPAPVTLRVTYVGQHALRLPQAREPGVPSSLPALAPFASILGLFFLRRRTVRKAVFKSFVLLAILLSISGALSGCGSGIAPSQPVALALQASSMVETKTQTLAIVLNDN